MKRFEARVLLAVVLWLCAPWSASATSTLAFDGGGYWIDMEIGDDRGEAIASVRFHRPGEPEGIVLPRSEWHADAFDTRQQVLRLRHAPGESGVAGFTLSVRRDVAVLTIGGRRIRSAFRWTR